MRCGSWLNKYRGYQRFRNDQEVIHIRSRKMWFQRLLSVVLLLLLLLYERRVGAQGCGIELKD